LPVGVGGALAHVLLEGDVFVAGRVEIVAAKLGRRENLALEAERHFVVAAGGRRAEQVTAVAS
jgi:hypothetical protein